MKSIQYTLIFLFFLGVSLNNIDAQSKRDLLLEGDFMYETENYSDAEANYQKAADKSPDFQSHFNLGVSQEKQVTQSDPQTAQQAMGEPQENPNINNALNNYQSALSFAKDDTERSMSLYNMGNTMIADKANISIEKLEEAIENYKASIRYDKNNDPARHNLALTQVMLDRAKQQEQQQQQQENQDSESEEQEQEQEEKEEQEQEQQEEEEQQDQQEDQKSKEEKEQEMEAQKQKVDEKEIENILKMVEQEDKEVQQKMRKQSKSSDTNKKKKW